MYPYVHCCTIYSGQDMKQLEIPPIDHWIKVWCARTHTYIHIYIYIVGYYCYQKR